MEPDLGTAGVYVIAAGSVFFMAGANLFYIGAIGTAVLGAAWLMITSTSYQLTRVETFLDPFRDPLRTGLQRGPGALRAGPRRHHRPRAR